MPGRGDLPRDALPAWVPFIRINCAYSDGMEHVNGLVQEQIAQSPPPPIAGRRG